MSVAMCARRGIRGAVMFVGGVSVMASRLSASEWMSAADRQKAQAVSKLGKSTCKSAQTTRGDQAVERTH